MKGNTLTSSERDEIRKGNFVAHRGDIFYDVGLLSWTVSDAEAADTFKKFYGITMERAKEFSE